MRLLSNEEGNEVITNSLKANDLFFAGRVGISEIEACGLYDSGIPIPLLLKNKLCNMAGVYGNCIDEFCTEYIKSIQSCDIQIYWKLDTITNHQNNIFKKYCSCSTFVENRSIEPFYFKTPWSLNLENKKVLVISPFSESIKEQYKHKNNIWANKVLPDFNLLTYKSIQSIGNTGPHHNWIQSLDVMKEEVSKLDFDVALLGCGAYGMPLASHIKNNLKKTSIYIGGSTQILFGIKGKRWDVHSEVSSLYNDYWIRPKKEETPDKFEVVEGGTYW
jgi:hypothetical protein